MLRSVFILAILIPGFALALRDRFAALLFYIWFALFRPQEFLWIDITPFHLSLIIGLVLTVPCLLTGRWPDISHPLSKGAVLIVVFALLAHTGAVNPEVSWQWTEHLLKLVLVCLLATRLISTKRDLILVVMVMACSLGFHSAKAGLMSIVRGGVEYQDGLGGSFITNNGYALAAAMVTFLLVACGQMVKSQWVRRGFLVAALASTFTVVSTFSRGGFVALVAGSLAFVLVRPRRVRLMVGLIMLGLGAYTFVPLPEGYGDRIQTIAILDKPADTSIRSRPHYWRIALAMASDYPFGVGLRNFESAYDSYDISDGAYGRRRDVHSSYFQMIAETGFGGGALFLGLTIYTLVILLRIRSRVANSNLSSDERQFFLAAANGLLASMTAFMVGGAFGSYALNDLTWLSIAVTAALDRITQEEVRRASESHLGADVALHLEIGEKL
jgi:putative inorganic carbon (hco3(-)) transporter